MFSYAAAKLVPLAYGIKKLQIGCVVEDDKVCAVQCSALVMVSSTPSQLALSFLASLSLCRSVLTSLRKRSPSSRTWSSQ